MHKIRPVTIVCLFCCIALIFPTPLIHAQDNGLRGAVKEGESAPERTPEPEPEFDEDGEEIEPEDESAAPKGIEALSLQQRIAQMMIVRLGGQLSPDHFDRVMIEEMTPGGVILPNITMPLDMANYVLSVRANKLEVIHEIPLLVGADVLSQTPAQFDERPLPTYLQLPSLMGFAAADVSVTSTELAKKVADHLARMGFNFHMGPSLSLSDSVEPQRGDVNTLGGDPEFTAEWAHEFHAALQEKNIAWIPQDFPGGAQNRGKEGPPILLTPKSQLRDNDLLPFVTEFEHGLDFIHVGNILAPSLDSSLALASLSPSVIEQHLRTNLGFEGIVVVGPLDGRQLRRKIEPQEAAVQAIKAGADMLYWEEASPLITNAVVAIMKAVASGEIDEEIINERVERILAMKENLELIERPAPGIRDAEKLLNERSNWKEPTQLERRSITLVHNRSGVLPISGEHSSPIGITGTIGVDELYEVLKKDRDMMLGKMAIRSARHTSRVEDFELERVGDRVAGTRVGLCLLSDDIDERSQRELLKVMAKSGTQIVAIVFGHPKDLSAYDDADAVIIVYGKPNEHGEIVSALADVLVGRGEFDILPPLNSIPGRVGEAIRFDWLDVIRTPVGRLPVDVPGLYKAGQSAQYAPSEEYFKIKWEFGDGKKSKDFVADHAYKEPGEYHVTLTLSRKKGEERSETYTVVVQ